MSPGICFCRRNLIPSLFGLLVSASGISRRVLFEDPVPRNAGSIVLSIGESVESQGLSFESKCLII